MSEDFKAYGARLYKELYGADEQQDWVNIVKLAVDPETVAELTKLAEMPRNKLPELAKTEVAAKIIKGRANLSPLSVGELTALPKLLAVRYG